MNDRIYCHVVWTTRHRAPILDAGLATFLSRFLRDVARQEQAHILEIGMVATHVHILLRIAPTTRLPRLLQRLKGGSAVIANRERRSTAGIELQWSKGYSIQVRDLDVILARPEMRYLPRAVREGWGPATNPYTRRIGKDRYPGIMALYGVLEKLVRGFQTEGVRLLVGTDAMNTGTVPGFSTHDELADLVTAGLTPYQALHAATANAAEFLGPSNQHGTVAVGQNADLVLLDANPLENMANSRRVAGVMLRGHWLSRADLDQMLDELRSDRD